MKRNFSLASLFSALAILLFSIAGCTEDPVEPQAKIGKPTNVVLQKLSANSFSVSWTRAQNDNGANTVTIVKTAPTTAQWQLTVASPLSVLTVQDTSITNTGGSFTVTVASKDSTSAPVTITFEPEAKIGKPTNVILQKLSANSFRVSWTRAQNDNETDTVNIIRTAPSGAQWMLTAASPTSVLTVVDTSITNTGGSFTVTVRSKDSISAPASITISTTDVPAPTNVSVTSISSTEIAVRWIRNGETGVDTVIASPIGGGATIIKPVILSTPAWLLTGLLPDVRYNIAIASSTGNRSVPVEWATATRSTKLTLYETADPTSGHHSGLILGPIAKAASITGAEKNQIDLVLATDNTLPGPPFLSFQGADVVGSGIPGGKATRIGDVYYIVKGGLDKDFYSTSFANEFTLGVNYFPVLSTTTDPVILLVRTADNHYARVEVVPQSNGLLWKDVVVSGLSYRAIDVIVSYQTIAGVGYASRPTEIRRGSNMPKVGGARRIVK